MKAAETTKRLKELIKVCGVMDLYTNQDDVRFQVIRQVIESKVNEINHLRQGIELMNQSAKWSPGKW
jgi:hypothetical protein